MNSHDGVEADTHALAQHAGKVGELAEVVELARQAAAHVTMDQAAYGKMWTTIPAILTPLQSMAANALEALSRDLAATSRDLRTAAATYDAADERSATSMSHASQVLPELPL